MTDEAVCVKCGGKIVPDFSLEGPPFCMKCGKRVEE